MRHARERESGTSDGAGARNRAGARPTLVLLLAAVGLAVPAWGAGAVQFGGDIAGLYRARPSFVHITSDQNIERVHWSSWGGRIARARATMVFSKADREPSRPVRLALSTIRRCGKRLLYLRLRVSYTAGKPSRERRSYVIAYTCRSPAG